MNRPTETDIRMLTHLATICNQCPFSYNDEEQHLRCKILNSRVKPFMQKKMAFCPLYYHTLGVPSTHKLKYELKFYANGIAKLLISWFRLCMAPASVIKTRKDICRSCEFFTGTNCSKCGCLISAKTSLATEQCPENKWQADQNTACSFVRTMYRKNWLKVFMEPAPSYVFIMWLLGMTKKSPKNGSDDCNCGKRKPTADINLLQTTKTTR